MSSSKKRPRWQRRPVSGSPSLSERDIDIVAGVYKYRALSTRQVQYLYFGLNNRSGAQRRLDVLFDHEILDRRFLPPVIGQGRQPTLYTLTMQGANLLRLQKNMDVRWHYTYGDVSDSFLAHTYALSQVMVMATVGCRLSDELALLEWLTERELKAEYNQNRERDRVPITVGLGNNRREMLQAFLPDSVFLVERQRLFRFVVELDRAEESLGRWQRKIQGIIEYHRLRRYEERFKGRSMKVLTVVDSAHGDSRTRLQNLKDSTEAAGGKTRFWFARLADLSHENFWFEPVWQVATETSTYPLFS